MDLFRQRLHGEREPGGIEDAQVVGVDAGMEAPRQRGDAEENGEGASVLVPLDLGRDLPDTGLHPVEVVDFAQAGGAAGHVVRLQKAGHRQLVRDAPPLLRAVVGERCFPTSGLLHASGSIAPGLG